MQYTSGEEEASPIVKFAGFTSLCIKWRPCNASHRSNIWSASFNVVFSENRLPHFVNNSSRDGPSKSRTMTLKLLWVP